MYILFIAFFWVSSSLSCSIPQQQNTLDLEEIKILALKCPVEVLHQSVSPIQNNTSIILSQKNDSEIQGELFFACLPKELRMYTLTKNFFNDDISAAEVFEKKPYVYALCLLAEYQQKPHPYLHLSPKFIFLLHPHQVAVVNEIEQQYIQSSHATPATPLVSQWCFQNKQPAYAQLNHTQLKILQTVPPEALEISPLKEKTIAYGDSPLTLHHIIKDTSRSIVFDASNHTFIGKAHLLIEGLCGLNYLLYHHLTNTPWWNIGFLPGLIHNSLCVLLLCRIIPWQSNDIFKSYTYIRTPIDLIGLGVYAAQYGCTEALSKIFLTSLPSLGLGISFAFCFISGARSATPFANCYTIQSNKKKNSKTSCTLV